MSDRRTTRRTVLRSVAGTAVLSTLAAPGSAVLDGGDGVIAGLTVHDGAVYVQLSEPTAADFVAAHRPDGYRRFEAEVGLGETAAAVPMLETEIRTEDGSLDTYLPDFREGTYTFVAFRRESGTTERVGRARLSLAPDVAVTGLRHEAGGKTWVQVENHGNAPVRVRRIALIEGVLSPDSRAEGSEHDFYLDPGRRAVVPYRPDVSGPGFDEPPLADDLDDESRADARAACDGRTERVRALVETSREEFHESEFEATFEGGARFGSTVEETWYWCEQVRGGERLQYGLQ